MFGPHLMLDCYDCKESKLKDLDFILNFLDDLPNLIHMHKIAKPYAVNYEGKEDSFDKGGISAIVIIAESHISCHTFPLQKFVSVDIFSCKKFDADKASEFIIKSFEAKRFERRLINRGLEFPKEVPKAMKIVDKQRKTLYAHKANIIIP